eukprot:evm.model.scf_2781.2 EVM.evm.TU.scf_2781.2   scf_2781:5688-7780(-)
MESARLGASAAALAPHQSPLPPRIRPPHSRKRPSGPLPARPSDPRGAEPPAGASGLLDRFLEARGVFDPERRAELVDLAAAVPAREAGEVGDPLPGVAMTWEAEARAEQVAALSRRLEQLHDLFGGRMDIVFMCVREPALLTADIHLLAQRLLDMKLSDTATTFDILNIISKQPHLLLRKGGSAAQQETCESQLRAWQFGLVSDADVAWSQRCDCLVAYAERHGDSHVGFREGDDPDLARWAEKQRDAFSRGQLDPDKIAQLEDLGFEFEAADAEWMRWFGEFKKCQVQQDGVDPFALANGTNFLLTNWCSVQRVARRCGVLSRKRRELLSAVQFDWEAADALS